MDEKLEDYFKLNEKLMLPIKSQLGEISTSVEKNR